MSPQVAPGRSLRLSFYGVPPRAASFCRLVGAVAATGVRELVIDWEEAFPWSIDARMAGPGAFSDQEVSAVRTAARRTGVTLVPRLARHGLPYVLDRVEGFTHLTAVSCGRGQLEAYAAAALRMVERVVDDVLEIFDSVPRLEFGHAVGSAAAAARPEYRAQFLAPLEALVRDRGVEPVVESEPAAALSADGASGDGFARRLEAAQPVECTVARALGSSGVAERELAHLIVPVVECVEQLDATAQRGWSLLRCVTAALHAATRHCGSRTEILADRFVCQELDELSRICAESRHYLGAVLEEVMEPPVAAAFLGRRLAPIEELTATLRARVHALS